MKFFRPFQAALAGAALAATAFAQTEADINSLRTKAQRGNAVAQYNLGLAYLEGRGTGADPIEAYVWLSLARENGARGRALDNLIATLDNSTLEAARQQLAERHTTLGLRAPASGTVPNTTPVAESGSSGAPNTPPGAPNAPLVATAPTPATADASAAVQRQLDEAIADKRALSNEIASAWKEVDALKARLTALTAEIEHARQDATAAATDKKQLSAEVASAWQEVDALKARLAAAENAKPTVDPAALDQKARELQAALGELESARRASAQLTASLATADEARAGLERQLHSAQAAALEADRRRDEFQTQLTASTAAASQAKQEAETARQALAARPAAPSYPDLSGRVAELEASLAAVQQALTAKPAAPAYPDLRPRVGELEAQLAEARRPQTPAYPDLRERAATLESQLAEAQKPRSPAYPDLSGRVRELTAQLAERDAQVQASLVVGRQLKDALTELRQAHESFTALQTENARLQALAEKPAAPAYPDLSGRVQELEASAAKLTAQTQAAEKARAQAQAELDGHRDSFHTAEREHVTLLAQNKMLESDKASLRRQIDASSADAAQLRSQVATLKGQLAEKPAAPAHPDLRGKVAELESELATARQTLAAKPTVPDYPDLSGRVTELETQLADARQALAEKPAAPAYPDLSDRVRELETSLGAASARVAESNTLANEHTKLVTDLQEELKKTREKLAAEQAAPAYPDLRGRVGELETQLAATAADAERAKQETEAARQALAAKPAAPDYPDLRPRVGELETQLAATQQAAQARPAAPAYPDFSGRVRELETQLNDMAGRAGNLETKLLALAAAKSGVDTELQATRQQLSRAQQESADAAAAIDQLRADHQALQTRLDRASAPAYPDLRARVGELETQLAAAQSAAQAKPAAPAYPDLSGRVQELESALASAAGKTTAAEQTRAELARQFDDYRSSTLAAQREQVSLQSQVQMLESEKAALRRQADTTDAEATLLRAQVAKLKELSASAPATPAYPDLRDRVGELEAQVVALRDAPPAFPDLRSRVSELEQQLAAARAPAQTAAPAYPDLRDRVGELEAQVAALRHAPPAYPDLRGRVGDLEAQLAAAEQAVQAKPTAPDYPDLRVRVAELEQQLAARPAPPSTPDYPDLRGRVSELERQLAAVPSTAAQVADPAASDLPQRLAETEDRLATSLRGYALLEKERDELAAQAAKSSADLTADRNSLAARLADTETKAAATQADVARLTEQVGALQRASVPVERELAAARALLDQLRGTNTVLAQENYQLKSRLAGAPAATAALPALRTHAVAAGDSLSKISQRYYGTASRWPDIYNANRDVISPEGVLRVGSTLRIP